MSRQKYHERIKKNYFFHFRFLGDNRILLGITDLNITNKLYIVESEGDRKIIKASGTWNGLILTENRDNFLFTLFISLQTESKKEWKTKLNYLRRIKLVPVN